MDRFSEISMPPESPNPNYNPCENVLRHIQDMDEAIEAEQRSARTRQFMNLVNEAETGNVLVTEEMGATGGQAPSPPHHVTSNPDPANIQIVNEYNSFNLQNITPPIAPKWKHSETLLDDFLIFKCSYQQIFDGPMCHIKSGKVKTSMFLIWAGPDGEDIYESFNLPPHEASDVDLVIQRFEEFCKPICKFRVARFKFTKVFQQKGEAIDTFYNQIPKLAHQCEFSDMNERLKDAIIFSTNYIKAQDKLLQTPKLLSLQQCLTVCRHYESLKLHIQQIRPDKHVEYLKNCHQKSKQKSKPNPGYHDKSLPRRNQNQADKQLNKTGEKCFGCGQECHRSWPKECPAWGQTCRRCNKLNHYEIVCRRGLPPPPRMRRN